jgi:hypothetical protein
MESRKRYRLPRSGLPTHKQLRQAFEAIPVDPWTGYPAGYVSFSVELDARRESEKRLVHSQRKR